MIVLVTLNARYIHASLGLRYLLANMGDMKPRTVLREFTIARKPQDIVNELLVTLDGRDANISKDEHCAQVVGFGVYIWNVVQTTAVIRLLKTARPGIKIVLGGPEVSHEVSDQEIIRLADHVITGWGDVSFAKLCFSLLQGQRPLNKIIAGERPPLDQITLPYAEYSEADIASRLLYVEASRGCPFKCHFCLSSLDETAWAFDLEAFLAQMLSLHRRGARNFKFVDRTFNLKTDASIRILQFFLDRLGESDDELFVHFEVVPDHFPDRLKQIIAEFPPGVLQFEVGIQSFNPEVQERISRKQDNDKTEANLRWLLGAAEVHLHADLIFGLPGETLDSFAGGFDRLCAMQPHEIQLGILKRLRGTPIVRHGAEFGMIYDPDPPYAVRQTGAVDAPTVTRFTRFARYWDLIANSGRFNATLKLLLTGTAAGDEDINVRVPSPFYAFLGFSDWLWRSTAKTSGLTPERLVDALSDYLVLERGETPSVVQRTLLDDYVASGARGRPETLKGLLPGLGVPFSRTRQFTQRQDRHHATRRMDDSV